MSLTKLMDRQYPLAAVAELGVAHVGAGNEVEFALPINAQLLSIAVQTVIGFDGLTSTITVGDGTTVFVNGADVSAPGNAAGTNVPKFYPTGGKVTAQMVSAGATIGKAILTAQYVVLNRGGERQD